PAIPGSLRAARRQRRPHRLPAMGSLGGPRLARRNPRHRFGSGGRRRSPSGIAGAAGRAEARAADSLKRPAHAAGRGATGDRRQTFGDWVFDSDTRQVFRAGNAIALSPKAFELLDLLVRERPRALSKEQIHGHLWPDVFVSDASLSNLIAELRNALGDDADKPK